MSLYSVLVFLWVRGMRHAENAFNKIIQFRPFCSHFSWICVHSHNAVPLLPPPPPSPFLSTTIAHEQIQGKFWGKTRAAAKLRSWLKAPLLVMFLPLGTWHPLRLSLALRTCLFCDAYPPRRCSRAHFSKRYHCNWLNIWCVCLALTWRHPCKRCQGDIILGKLWIARLKLGNVEMFVLFRPFFFFK